MSVLLALALTASIFQTPTPTASPAPTTEAAEAQAVADALFKAFEAGDVPAFTAHFADKVLFIGDPQFLGEERGRQVTRTLTRDNLSAAYKIMLDKMGRPNWQGLVTQAKKTVRKATKNESHAEDTTGVLPADFIKAGEYVCELRFPGSGLDDVILFVMRRVDGKFKVIAHWADY